MKAKNIIAPALVALSTVFTTPASADSLELPECQGDDFQYTSTHVDGSSVDFLAFNVEDGTSNIKGLCKMSFEQSMEFGMKSVCGLGRAEGQTTEDWLQAVQETCGNRVQDVPSESIVRVSGGYTLKQ